MTPPRGTGRGGSAAGALLVIVAASLALELAVAWQLPEMRCSGDECHYTRLAGGILEGRGLEPHKGYLRPPGYPYFVAALRAGFGPGRFALAAVQAAIACGTLLAVYGIGAALYDRRAGLAAASLLAFYPNLVAFTHLFFSETLYLFWLTTAFLVLVQRAPVSPRRAAVAGCLLGLAALTRGVALYLAPVLAFGVAMEARAGDRRGRALAAAALLAATLLTLLPWTLRNWATFDRFLPIDTTAGRNLYVGLNRPLPSNYDFGMGARRAPVWRRGGRPHCTEANLVDRERCEVRNALRFAASNPGAMLSRVPGKLADLLSPTSTAIRLVRSGLYAPNPSQRAEQLATLVFGVPWMLLATLGLAGLLLAPPARHRGLLWLVPAFHLAISAATFGMSRFRLPLLPFLAVAAAPLLTRSGRRLIRGQPAWRTGAALLGIAALGALWWQRWDRVFDVFAGPG